MIQQKHIFLIKRESVRRMYRAKPSARAIVVQLLVDCDRRTRSGFATTRKYSWLIGGKFRAVF